MTEELEGHVVTSLRKQSAQCEASEEAANKRPVCIFPFELSLSQSSRFLLACVDPILFDSRACSYILSRTTFRSPRHWSPHQRHTFVVDLDLVRNMT